MVQGHWVLGFWYNSVSTRKEKARKGADNDLNGVGPWAFVFCMPCKLCTPISADEVLGTCLVPERGQSFQEYLPYFYIPSSPTCVLAELAQCCITPGFTHLVYISLFQRSFTSSFQSKLPFLFLLSSPFSFPLFPSFLFSIGNPPRCQERPKLESYQQGVL